MTNILNVCNTMCMEQLVLKSKEGSSYEIEINSVSKEDLNYLFCLFNSGKIQYNLDNKTWIVSEQIYNELENKFSVDSYFNLGSCMKLQPYDYQKEVANFILHNKKALTVLPCGAGKTVIVICSYLEALHKNVINGPGLIIVKASLKYQWQQEVGKFSDLKATVIKTYSELTSNITNRIKTRESKKEKTKELKEEIKQLKKERSQLFKNQFKGYDLYICNYETLLDKEVSKELLAMNLEFVAADEIQYAKSDTSKRNKALAKFGNAKMTIGATATPVQNNPLDIYGLFKFIQPELFPKKTNFSSLYLKYGGYGRVIGAKNTRQLHGKIKPYMITKKKEEVAKQLPQLVVNQLYCEFEPEQLEMSNKLLDELAELKRKLEVLDKTLSPAEALHNEERAKLDAGIMARQAFAQELANSELLLSESESEMAKQYVTGCKENHKLDLLMNLVEEIIESGEKVCIFSKFRRMQDVITNRVREMKSIKDVGIAYINGGISGQDRYNEVYNKFKNMDNYKILLCSDSGAEGLNLNACKYLIEYEAADSYAIQTQRHGRLERADSIHDTVFVYQLIVKDSYDEIGQKIINKKRKYDAEIVKGMY